jgi:hypothetical protein
VCIFNSSNGLKDDRFKVLGADTYTNVSQLSLRDTLALGV